STCPPPVNPAGSSRWARPTRSSPVPRRRKRRTISPEGSADAEGRKTLVSSISQYFPVILYLWSCSAPESDHRYKIRGEPKWDPARPRVGQPRHPHRGDRRRCRPGGAVAGATRPPRGGKHRSPWVEIGRASWRAGGAG